METVTTPTEKRCSKCLVEKPFSAFGPNHLGKYGLRSRCRECEAKYQSEYYADNREKESARRVERYARLRNRADHEIEIPTQKICPKCGETKPASEFSKSRTSLDGLAGHCKLCDRWKRVQYSYGLSRSEWEAMWEAQGGRCAICSGPMERDSTPQDPLRVVVDHHPERSGPGCHRALLHALCNRSLLEDPDTLRRMSVYVEVGIEALLPGTPINDTLDTLFGHLSAEQARKRWRRVRYKYRVEPEEWLAMWNRQAGLCPCCQEPMEASSEKPNRLSAVVDHCHTGGQVRALLDSECNAILGLFLDSPAILRRAARYLELGAEGPVDVARLDADHPVRG